MLVTTSMSPLSTPKGKQEATSLIDLTSHVTYLVSRFNRLRSTFDSLDYLRRLIDSSPFPCFMCVSKSKRSPARIAGVPHNFALSQIAKTCTPPSLPEPFPSHLNKRTRTKTKYKRTRGRNR
jgi:hypothetical protein